MIEIGVDAATGQVLLAELLACISPRTCLVSVMLANNGPRIGALATKAGVPLNPLMTGGGQEGHLRAG